MSHQKIKLIKLLIKSLKIAIGSVAAILIASWLELEFATSAGIITLLSVVSTKWDTLKLSAARILSFFAVIMIAFMTYPFIQNDWVAYGVFIFVTVLFSGFLGIESTISINAVVGTHFLTTHDHSFAFIYNEFLLVFIGISLAIILNLINGNGSQKKKLLFDMKYVEERLRMILDELAEYLRNEEKEKSVWQDIEALEEHLSYSIQWAYEYQGNTFASHPGYYIEYMEMRSRQCTILYSLHDKINKIKTLPVQAGIISDYISYLRNYVLEFNIPDMQEQELKRIFRMMKQEALPETAEEMENRAILYYILMDLEEFLMLKRRFIESLSEKQKQIYWKKST